MSSKGVSNTNGFESGDRDKGLARAEDRSTKQADRDSAEPGATKAHAHKSIKAHHHHVVKQTTESLGS
ncbi:hypothetical protein C9I57_07040 [Trinickia symbiotica]|uniref:Uncharacterized protein n=2 Tax=Trinickia symbiotica TaxID=863227 RepID=A0A2T3XY16_9BURK|nr:hypothetical protein C9I57_07040 [Trinickia symbiotica]